MSSLSIFSQKNSLFGSYKPEPLLSVTVEWLTQILEAPRKGKENRTAKLTEPRFSLEGSDFILTDESYMALSQAFINNDGQGSGFFFKCPLDYYVKATPEYYDTGVYQQGILHNLTGNTYQICKKYSVAGVNTYKTILGVIGSTLQVYKDNVLVTSGYTLNAELGTVTFSTAQTGVLTVSCEYELKFRFDVNDLQLKQIKRAIAEYGGDRNVYQSINFRLVEDDYSKVSPLETIDWTSAISYDFGDYKLPNTTYSERVLSRIEKGDNLKESREILTPVRRQFKYEQCNRNWNDLQRVYTLFNVAKGQLLPFEFEGINVRFDADSFGCEQLGRNAWSINEMGSIETLFSVENEVKNWAYFVALAEGVNLYPPIGASVTLFFSAVFNEEPDETSLAYSYESMPPGPYSIGLTNPLQGPGAVELTDWTSLTLDGDDFFTTGDHNIAFVTQAGAVIIFNGINSTYAPATITYTGWEFN